MNFINNWKGGATLLSVVLVFSYSFCTIEAHGHMTSPRSRNYFANQEGIDGWQTEPTVGVPPKENCPHCLNSNSGVCGTVNDGRSYDNFLDSTNVIMPWISQATYTEGENILIASYLDTHHNGHMTVSACADGPSSTQACFDTPGHELTFVSDILHGMPADPNYPERGYYSGGQGGGLKEFQFLFKLPDGIKGNQVMFQWKYITANSCSPPGYAEYFSVNNLPNTFWTPGLTLCTPPYPSDGTRSMTWPEQFFNCAEVTVNPAGTPTAPTTLPPVAPPSPQPPTTPTWPTPQPPTGNPPTSGVFCCSQNFKECVTWCGTSQDECENCQQDVFWIEKPQSTNCKARFDNCLGSEDSCCPSLQCIGDQYYKQCKYVPPLPTNPPVPTSSPTDPPVTTTGPTKTPKTSSPTKSPTATPTKAPSKAPTKTPTPPACPKPDEMEMIIEIKGDGNSGNDKNKWTLQRYDSASKNYEALVSSKKISKKKATNWKKCVPKDSCYVLHLEDKSEDGFPDGHYKVEFGNIAIDGKFNNGSKLVEMINCECSDF